MNNLKELENDTALQHRPLKEEIFELLHKRIIAGKYTPGAWLRQEDLSSQMGVSQTPVREALDLLVSAGLAERVPYRGVRVLQLSVEEMIDAYEMRLSLESSAAYAAALSALPEQIAEMEEILEQTRLLVSLNDMSQQRWLNRHFHLLIVAAAGNHLWDKLFQMVLNTFPDWMLYEYMFRHPELLESSLDREYKEHQAIIEAIAAHNPYLAAEKTLVHITNRSDELELFLGIPGERLRLVEQRVIGYTRLKK